MRAAVEPAADEPPVGVALEVEGVPLPAVAVVDALVLVPELRFVPVVEPLVSWVSPCSTCWTMSVWLLVVELRLLLVTVDTEEEPGVPGVVPVALGSGLPVLDVVLVVLALELTDPEVVLGLVSALVEAPDVPVLPFVFSAPRDEATMLVMAVAS